MNSAFVGRRAELSRLAQKLRRSQDGHGQLATIAGEAGIGKTRLMSEIASIATDGGSNVLWGQLIEDPFAPPYAAWTLVLRAYLQQVDDDTLQAELGSDAVHVADILPELRDRLALGESQPPIGNESAARYQLFECVSRLLLAMARRQPLVLLFDNFHLADQSSLLLLEHYAHQLTGSRTLVIAAHRDGDAATREPYQRLLTALGRTATSEHISLAGLDRDEVGQLLRDAIGTPPPATLVDSVYQRGDGNPLYTCQVAQALAGRQPAAARSSPDGSFEIPRSLSEAISDRFATVGEHVLDVLEKAAVLGRDFDTALLARLCEQDADKVYDSVERAAKAGIVVRLAPSQYRFDHALFREALYAETASADRLRLHHLAAQCLADRYGEAADPPLAQLSYHWFEASRGGYHPQAVDWCQRAAEAAVAKRAYGEATVQVEQALALVDMAADEDPARRFELLVLLANAQYHAGQQGLAHRTWLQAVQLAHGNGWPQRFAEALLQWQYVRAHTGFAHEMAVPLHEAALNMLPADAAAMRTRVLASLAHARRHLGDRDLAYKTMYESIELAREIGDPGVLFDCLIKAFYIVRTYDAQSRLPLLEESLRLAPSTGRDENVLLASAAVLFPLSDLGRFDDVRRQLAVLDERARASRHLYWLQFVAGFRVKLAMLDGRWEEALKIAQDSLRQGSFEGATGIEGRFSFQMFTIHRAMGTLGNVAPLLARVAAAGSEARTWLPGRILLHCELGQKKEALEALAQLGDYGDVTTDDLYETDLVYLAEACARLGDTARCQEVYDRLRPYRGTFLNMVATVSHGTASGYLAMLAAALGRNAEARELYEEALEQYKPGVAPVLRAQTRVNYAEFLLKSESPDDNARALQLLSWARNAARRLKLQALLKRIDALADETARHSSLTSRELDVLSLIADGASNKGIADKLSISVPTVATHVRNILRKTATQNRTEAVAYARSCGMLRGE